MNLKFATIEELEPKFEKHAKQLEKQLRVKGNCIVFHIPNCDEYAIELSRCNSAESILGWVHHLSEKRWISTELICRFIELATSHHKIQLMLF